MSYRSSVYLYARPQLIYAPLLGDVVPWLEMQPGGDVWMPSLKVRTFWRQHWRERAARLRTLVIALLALEPLYLPQVTGNIRLETDPGTDWDGQFRAYHAWRDKQPLGRPLRWLGVNAQWIADAGVELLRLADRIDPLGDWAELLPYAEPASWSRLKGHARSAVDLRLAAEVLFRYGDDLAAGGRMKALPDPDPRYRGVMDHRLKRRRPLDAVLSDFGLSPHPRLVLVVEGKTELTLFPKVMRVFGIRTDEDFISLQEAGGVDRDLAPLVAYLAPRLGARQTDTYVHLNRNPTRILVVLDAEGKAETKEQRGRRRDAWVQRLMDTLPRELRLDPTGSVIREQLDRLVEVTTWNQAGDSFEFAHFTDRQIAHAIWRLDPRPNRPGLDELVPRVASLRSSRGNLDRLLYGASKPDLGLELWPYLERRLSRVRAGADGRRIPIVRVLDKALGMAHEFGRGRIVLALAR